MWCIWWSTSLPCMNSQIPSPAHKHWMVDYKGTQEVEAWGLDVQSLLQLYLDNEFKPGWAARDTASQQNKNPTKQTYKQRNHNNPPSNKNCISIYFSFLSFPHKHSVTIAYEALTCGMAGFMDGDPMDRVE